MRELPDGLRGLDGAAHVGVLHQALTERDAGFLRIADGRLTIKY